MRGQAEILKEVLQTKKPKIVEFKDSHEKAIGYRDFYQMINHSQTYGCLYINSFTETSFTIRYNHEMDVNKVKDKTTDPNAYLKVFANMATANGMSYGELQQKETLYIRAWGKLPNSLTNEERVHKILQYSEEEGWLL